MTAGRALAAGLTALMLTGCGGENIGVMRLDGKPETRATLSIAEAGVPARAHPVLVHGYLYAPYDERWRLCTKLDGGACEGPSLLLVGLDVERVDGVKEGCCAVGYLFPRELSIRGTVANGFLFVDPQAV